jgi:hypothetical protein
MRSKLRNIRTKREIRKISLKTKRLREINSGVKSTSSRKIAGRKSKCYRKL